LDDPRAGGDRPCRDPLARADRGRAGGAFLRQDWLFYLVLSPAAIRKRCFKIAGASLVYAGLLRIFPGLIVIGTLVPFVTHIIQKRRLHRDHKQMLWGGVLAAAVLVPLVQNNEWFFDTELLVLAEKKGYRIKDIPVKWIEDPDTRVKLAKTIREDLSGLWRLRTHRIP